jgi:hypothetical protein
MQALRIILLCTAAAILYGVIHDQVTARVCIEYFTVFHPRVIDSQSPTALATVWGILATWWVGLLLGLGMAIASRAGGRPKLSAGRLIKPMSTLLVCMAAISLIAGVVGWWLADAGALRLPPQLSESIAPNRHALFMGDLLAHQAAYAVGFLGGIVLCVSVWRKRSAC